MAEKASRTVRMHVTITFEYDAHEHSYGGETDPQRWAEIDSGNDFMAMLDLADDVEMTIVPLAASDES